LKNATANIKHIHFFKRLKAESGFPYHIFRTRALTPRARLMLSLFITVVAVAVVDIFIFIFL
jgi:hypothetical protein